MGIKYGGRSTTPSLSKRADVSRAAGTTWHFPEVRLRELLEQLEPTFREVVRRALFNEPGRFDRFVSVPASVNGHHSVKAGNLLHTIDVAECALMLAKRYEPLVDKDVLLAAALLHDIGKCEEYEDTPDGTTMSDTGEMVGHKIMGGAMVYAAFKEMLDANNKRALAVMNAIASTSSRSFDMRGPATLEAIIVSKADQISAAADLYRQSLESAGGYDGVKHRHMMERPRHPVALLPVPVPVPVPVPAQPTTQTPRPSRSQRFGGF